MSRFRTPLFARVLVLCSLLGSGLAPAASATAADGPARGHDLPRPHPAGVAVPATTGSTVIDVVVPLHLSPGARAGIAKLAHGHASAFQRRTQLRALTPAPWQAARVAAWAEQHGFTVTSTTPWSVGLRGRAASLAAAFGTSLHATQFHGKGFVVPQQASTVPSALAGAVEPVVGLDTRPLFSGRAVYGGGDVQVLNSTPLRGSGSGAGATVATVNLSGWHPEDLHTYRAAAFGTAFADSAPAPTPVVVAGGHVAATVAEDDYGVQTEVALDAEAIAGVAPAAKQRMYFGGNSSAGYLAVLNQLVTDLRDQDPTKHFQTASTSWGTCELDLAAGDRSAMQDAIRIITVLGATFFAASGDNGAFDCGDGATPAVDFPAAAPDSVAVGGTTVTGTAPSYTSTAWSGSGGGCSSLVPAPAWQAVAGNPCSRRAVPDIATLADPGSGFWVYDKVDEWMPIGGTSLAAPASAAGLAAVMAHAGLSTLSTPFLATAYANPGAFTDVTAGDNGLYRAGAGFDLVTGLGSPRWTGIEAALKNTGEVPPTGHNEPLLAIDPTHDPTTASVDVHLPFGGTANGFAANGEPVTGYAISTTQPTDCSSTSANPPATAQLPGGEGVRQLWLSVTTGAPDFACIIVQRPVVADSVSPVAPKPVVTYVGAAAPAYRFTWAAATDATSGLLAYAVTVRDLTTNTDRARSFTTGRAFPYPGAAPFTAVTGHRYAVKVVAFDGAFNFAGQQTTFLAPFDDAKASLSRHLSSGRYVSDWARQKSSADFLGSHVLSNRKGAAYSFRFSGKTLTAGMPKSRYGGYADVYVDGVKRSRFSLYSSTTKYRQPVRLATFTTPGAHTVVVKVVGSHATGSAGNYVYLDSLTVGI